MHITGAITCKQSKQVWYCCSTSMVSGDKYDHIRDHTKAAKLSLKDAKEYKAYFESLGYKVTLITHK